MSEAVRIVPKTWDEMGDMKANFEWDCTLGDMLDEITSSPKKKVIQVGEFAWRGEGEKVTYVPISEVIRVFEKYKKC